MFAKFRCQLSPPLLLLVDPDPGHGHGAVPAARGGDGSAPDGGDQAAVGAGAEQGQHQHRGHQGLHATLKTATVQLVIL